jgi:hypothetical protein
MCHVHAVVGGHDEQVARAQTIQTACEVCVEGSQRSLEAADVLAVTKALAA